MVSFPVLGVDQPSARRIIDVESSTTHPGIPRRGSDAIRCARRCQSAAPRSRPLLRLGTGRRTLSYLLRHRQYRYLPRGHHLRVPLWARGEPFPACRVPIANARALFAPRQWAARATTQIDSDWSLRLGRIERWVLPFGRCQDALRVRLLRQSTNAVERDTAVLKTYLTVRS